MKVNKIDATMPQPRQQQQHQQPSKPKKESSQLPSVVKTLEFKKIFETELRKVNNEKH